MSVEPRYRAETHLPRHAFDPQGRARAGDIWRAFQELAVGASTANGWAPGRYREQRCAFVIRSMSVVHHGAALYGQRYVGETWVRRMRRQMLSTREVRIHVDSEDEQVALASGTQEWVHVDADMKPVRGAPELIDAFPPRESSTIELPDWTPYEDGPRDESTFEFDVWNTWMDPLGHVNHPQYLDFAEEGLIRLLQQRDGGAHALLPKAETATFFRGLLAGDRAHVSSSLVGTTAAGLVSQHHIRRAEDGVLCAQATLHRAHPPAAGAQVRRAT